MIGWDLISLSARAMESCQEIYPLLIMYMLLICNPDIAIFSGACYCCLAQAKLLLLPCLAQLWSKTQLKS